MDTLETLVRNATIVVEQVGDTLCALVKDADGQLLGVVENTRGDGLWHFIILHNDRQDAFTLSWDPWKESDTNLGTVTLQAFGAQFVEGDILGLMHRDLWQRAGG